MLLSLFSLLLMAPSLVSGAPKAELWTRWQANDPASTRTIDHSDWLDFLYKYLITDHPSGINRMRYAQVTAADRKRLADYLSALQEVKVSTLNRLEQKAYWINLYNAVTVKVVLDHYPVNSIRDIDISPGFFSNGPWDRKLLAVEGVELSLNDIEHRILRPIWRDNRIHYAVNCASLSCPNLQPEPYTARNLETLLDIGARAYVNHPRGVSLSGKKLKLSSIYDWYQEDFGGSEQGVLDHLRKYAAPPLANELQDFTASISYHYDWSLNK